MPGAGATPPAAEAIEQGGARAAGVGRSWLLYGVAVAWSLFQLWIASPLPAWFDWGDISSTHARSVHLGFALFLAFALFPARALVFHVEGYRPQGRVWALLWLAAAAVLIPWAGNHWLAGRTDWPALVFMAAVAMVLAAMAWTRPATERVPAMDWVLGLVAMGTSVYLYVFHGELAMRPGSPLVVDLVVAGAGMVFLLEAARRSMGAPLVIIAVVFLVYGIAGPWMPDLIAHRGASFARTMSQQWLSSEGVFGIPLGVSTSFVFLFVLFGALLNQAGAGGYFIRVAFAFLGHMRGGPAKASVIASGLTGLVSGSSIANTVTTGTFTIPLMRRVGFSAEKAGAIEVSSSVNGQIMPPVMGAAAFLMAEYVGIAYHEVIRHAFLPAVISYVALIYIVHLEALKHGMEGQPRSSPSPLTVMLLRAGLSISGLFILAGVVYFGLVWLQAVLGDWSTPVIAALTLGSYVALLAVAVRSPDSSAGPDATVAPEMSSSPWWALVGGLHFLLPVVVLIWALVVERLSPGLSAFYAVAFLIGIVLTQRPLMRIMAGEYRFLGGALREGVRDLFLALATGARNMVGIAIATATAGIIVGTVGLTGIGLVMTEVVETLSGGNLMLLLALTAVISLILGLGLPTTANYIIVATLMAPVVVELGAQAGLVVPLIAVHLFVFYFGLMADVTPPVGLASYAAAAVSRGDPIRTGVQAIVYNLRTLALPFLFIFNTQLLLIGVEGAGELALVVASAVAAMLLFAAGTQGWFVTRSRLVESAVLLLAAFTLFRPDFWMDRVAAPYEHLGPEEFTETVEALGDGEFLRFRAEGLDMQGREAKRTVMLRLGDAERETESRLRDAGVGVMALAGQVRVTDVRHGSPADRAGLESGWQITTVLVPAQRPAVEWFYLPALALAALVWLIQRRRVTRRSEQTTPAQE